MKVLITLVFSLGLVVPWARAESPERGKRFKDLYLLFIPALETDDGPAVTQLPDPVRLAKDNGHTVIRGMFPDLYCRKFRSKDEVIRDRMQRGWTINRRRGGKVNIKGVLFNDHGVGYYQVSLEGKEEEPNWWRGQAKVVEAGHVRAV